MLLCAVASFSNLKATACSGTDICEVIQDLPACRYGVGQINAGQGREGQGRAGQGRAGQGRAGQGRAGQGRTGQGGGRTGQGRADSPVPVMVAMQSSMNLRGSLCIKPMLNIAPAPPCILQPPLETWINT